MMSWIDDFDLFLFDFDGLLVNTEHLHFQAYVETLAQCGYRLDWTFAQFCEVAHLNATALKEALYAQFPNLNPDWNFIYGEKKRIYLDLVGKGEIELMPGVEKLLLALEKKGARVCVVTNSLYEQIELIRSQLPVLQTISNWITRELYKEAKPSAECYLKAIELYGQKGDRIIGFEDSVRGIEALKQTPALPLLISAYKHPTFRSTSEKKVLYFPSFEEIAFH